MPPSSYYERFGSLPRQIQTPPGPGLGLVVVIPCFCEPDLVATLESLWNCARPNAAVEVIVVINSAAGSQAGILELNLETARRAHEWITTRRDPHLGFHILEYPDLPPKHAGVGLARKIGMDEAARRFDDVGRPAGVIVCFDADSTCDPGYLAVIERHFAAHPRSPGASIYFEHPLSGNHPPEVYEAVAAYELHLRYYRQGLRYAGFPHAFHAIGSSMAVRAGAYQRMGGMNRRKAGEDFYFLNKLIPLGNFTEINSTRVIPSPRPSDRVPFGTGRAVREMLAGNAFQTYPLSAFEDLRLWLATIPDLYDAAARGDFGSPGSLPASIEKFLVAQDWPAVLADIRENTSSRGAFTKRFFRWFDAFRAMKFVHHARDHFHGPGHILRDPMALLERLALETRPQRDSLTVLDLLRRYRRLDSGRVTSQT
jgi:hypothetical protein